MKPADEPQVNIAPNASCPGQIVVAIGSGIETYSVTYLFAVGLAARLLDAAVASVRAAGT